MLVLLQDCIFAEFAQSHRILGPLNDLQRLNHYDIIIIMVTLFMIMMTLIIVCVLSKSQISLLYLTMMTLMITTFTYSTYIYYHKNKYSRSFVKGAKAIVKRTMDLLFS